MTGMEKGQTGIYKSAKGERAVMAIYDRVLANWPVPHEARSLPTRHGETFVISSGDAASPPLILLHGAASNALSWIGDVAAYSRHYRVHAIDLIGEPGRSAPTRPSWAGPAYVEWMEDLVQSLGVSHVSLAGISQGGWTALKYATARPAKVDKLVLLTPGGVAATSRAFILRAVCLGMFGRWGAERINRCVFGRQAIDPLAAEFMNTIMTNFKARVEKEYIFTDSELERLHMPLLLIGGQEDAVHSMPAIAARLERFAPRLRAVLLPGMGHAVVNQAERVLPFLLEDGAKEQRR